MLITGKHSISGFLCLVVDLILIVNILALILLPWMLTAIYKDPGLLAQLDRTAGQPGPDITLRTEYPADLPASSYPFYLGFLYAAGGATAWILVEGRLILRRLVRNEPFARGQTGSFRRVALAFAVLAVDFAIKVWAYNTLLTMFCGLLFLLLVLVALILSEIFRQAYLVKTENELTV